MNSVWAVSIASADVPEDPGCARARGLACLRAYQHLPAARRGGRYRDSVHDRRHPRQHPAPPGRRASRGTHQRLPLGLLGLRRHRPGRGPGDLPPGPPQRASHGGGPHIPEAPAGTGRGSTQPPASDKIKGVPHASARTFRNDGTGHNGTRRPGVPATRRRLRAIGRTTDVGGEPTEDGRRTAKCPGAAARDRGRSLPATRSRHKPRR